MNQDKILNMPAGIEMDMLIATQVFKRKPHPNNNKILGQAGRYVSPRHYSIAIMSAWEVVEKLCNENGCDVVKVCKRDPELLRGDWSCNFGLGFEAFGETAPLAICRAALLARGLTQRVPDAGDSAQ